MKEPEGDAAPDNEMERNPHERQIAEALAEHQAHRREGSPPALDTYARRLGAEAFTEFRALLAVEEAIDGALDAGRAPAVATDLGAVARRWVRPALAIAAGLLVCVLAWQWIDTDTSAPIRPVPGEPEAVHVALARLEREVLGREEPQRLLPLATVRGTRDLEIDYGLLPAGTLRPSDLRSLVLRIPEMAPLEGRLVFRRADGTILHSEPLERRRPTQQRPVPEEVTRELAAGGDATWGFETDAGSTWTVPIHVIPSAAAAEVERELERVRADARLASASEAERAWLEASLLLERGLFTAALRTSAALARGSEESGASPLPWIQMREALQRLGLLASPLGDPVLTSLDGFSPEEVAALVEARAPPAR